MGLTTVQRYCAACDIPENKVTIAIIITCRPRPILTFLWRLVTYKRLVSAGEVNISVSSQALTSPANPWL